MIQVGIEFQFFKSTRNNNKYFVFNTFNIKKEESYF